MKQNNKKFNNAMHKFVGVLDKYENMSCAFIEQLYDIFYCRSICSYYDPSVLDYFAQKNGGEIQACRSISDI